MQNIKIISIILLAFLLPLITSLLLNWSWIQEFIIRQIVVYLFMLVEFLLLIIVLLYTIKKPQNL